MGHSDIPTAVSQKVLVEASMIAIDAHGVSKCQQQHQENSGATTRWKIGVFFVDCRISLLLFAGASRDPFPKFERLVEAVCKYALSGVLDMTTLEA